MQSRSSKNLAQWLSEIETFVRHANPQVQMDALREFIKQQNIDPSPRPCVLIAGTNGKGTSAHLLSQILCAHGFRVGTYTSPHLFSFGERILLNLQPIDEEALCKAFEWVQQHSSENQWTYFGFVTLAAFYVFKQATLDFLVLEVGLGGTWDPVNAVEPSLSLITNIAYDHEAFLGKTREAIALAKSGILRKNIPFVYAEPDMPITLYERAAQVGAPIYQWGRDFSVTRNKASWVYSEIAYPYGHFEIEQAASVLKIVELLGVKYDVNKVQTLFSTFALPGRLMLVRQSPEVIYDVAHNPAAILRLAHYLRDHPVTGKTIAVMAMSADKAIDACIQAIQPEIDVWIASEYTYSRHYPAQHLFEKITQLTDSPVTCEKSLPLAVKKACFQADSSDRIVVFGSFYTIAELGK